VRRRVAKLAPHGRLEWDELDQRSDLIVSRLLDGLDGAQRTDWRPPSERQIDCPA